MNSYRSMNQMWSGAFEQLQRHGLRHESRAGETIEFVGWSACLEDVDRNFLVDPRRKLDPAYACAELLWYLSGERSVERMCAYAPSYKRFANPQTEHGVAWGAYGDRWARNPGFMIGREVVENMRGYDLKNQIDAAIYLLERKPETRQAVVTMWDSGDICEAIMGTVNDIPCTLSMQFIARGGLLHCSVCMRSNDVWLGLPYDVFCFSTVQRLVARRLGMRAGRYVHNVGSLHVYTRDLDKARTCCADLSVPADDSNAAHGYTYENDRAWDVAEALTLEEAMRTGKLNGAELPEEFASGGPLGDAAQICTHRLRIYNSGPRLPSDTASRISPALREGWKIKYG